MLVESLAHKFGFAVVDAWNYPVSEISLCDSHSARLFILCFQQAENLIIYGGNWDF